MTHEPRDTEEVRALETLGVTPRELAAAASGERASIPTDIDALLRAAAREREQHIRRRRPTTRRVASWIAACAAAATVIVATGLMTLQQQAATDAGVTADAGGPAGMDVNGDGSVDIADAFMMSRRIADGIEAPRGWDFDSSGSVDLADVDIVARAAVSL